MFKKSKITLVLSFLIFLMMLPSAIVKADTIQDLQFGVTAYGSITEDNAINKYKLVLPYAGKIDINLMSSICQVSMGIEDDKGNWITGDAVYYGDEQSYKESNVSVDLEAGTYYLKVSKDLGYLGKYKLLVNFTPVNCNDIEPNNDNGTAQPIGLNGTFLTGYLTCKDDIDVYKIVLPKAGKIDVNLVSYLNQVAAILRDANDKIIMNNSITDNSTQLPKQRASSVILEAGTYYLNIVKWYSGTGKYDVSVKYTPVESDENEPNDGTSTAQALILNEAPITGLLTANDRDDFYKITIPKEDDVYFYINSYMETIFLGVFDSRNNNVMNDYIRGSEDNPNRYSFNRHLPAGTYYIQVGKNGTSTGKYTLKVDCKSAMLTDDQLYANAYNATVNAMNVRTQNAINQARKAIEKLRYTGAEWAIGEFSKQVDQVQHPILVNICNAISAAQANPTQSNINAARATLDPELPAVWRSSYSSAVDIIQQGLMKRVVEAVEKAVATKAKADIDAANKLIEDVKTAADPAIAAWAVEMQKQLPN